MKLEDQKLTVPRYWRADYWCVLWRCFIAFLRRWHSPICMAFRPAHTNTQVQCHDCLPRHFFFYVFAIFKGLHLSLIWYTKMVIDSFPCLDAMSLFYVDYSCAVTIAISNSLLFVSFYKYFCNIQSLFLE